MRAVNKPARCVPIPQNLKVGRDVQFMKQMLRHRASQPVTVTSACTSRLITTIHIGYIALPTLTICGRWPFALCSTCHGCFVTLRCSYFACPNSA